MKLDDVKRFSAYISTIYHSEYITLQKATKLKNSPIYKSKQNTGTLQYQTSSERNGSSTCLASPSVMESNHYYRRAPSLL